MQARGPDATPAGVVPGEPDRNGVRARRVVAADGGARAGGRIQALDMVRGAAIIGVIVYHFGWDLNLFGFLRTDVTTHPAWIAFARSLAGTFMALVGVSLVLAHRTGIRWRPFVRRLGVVGAAAVLISAATYAMFPQSFVYFGILHAITVSSVLGLAFLRLPSAVVLLTAGLVFIIPEYVRFDALNARHLAWIGLASMPPPSNDFVPIFPWFALPLAGIVAARIAIGSVFPLRRSTMPSERRPAKALAWAGRHSLIIYLLHQPVLLALLYLFAFTAGALR